MGHYIDGKWVSDDPMERDDSGYFARADLAERVKLRDEITRLRSALADLTAALTEIAEQKTLEELSEAGEDCEGDFEGAYDIIIGRARNALAKHKDSTHDK